MNRTLGSLTLIQGALYFGAVAIILIVAANVAARMFAKPKAA